jgi:hypothetical protein
MAKPDPKNFRVRKHIGYLAKVALPTAGLVFDGAYGLVLHPRADPSTGAGLQPAAEMGRLLHILKAIKNHKKCFVVCAVFFCFKITNILCDYVQFFKISKENHA